MNKKILALAPTLLAPWISSAQAQSFDDGFTCEIVTIYESKSPADPRPVSVACVPDKNNCSDMHYKFCGPSNTTGIVRKTCSWVPKNQCKPK